MKKLINFYLFLFSIWVKFPQKIRFVLVGGWNFVVAYILFVIFFKLLGEEAEQTALLLSFLASTFHSYFTQKFFVFLTKGRYVAEYLKCLMSWVIGYFENALLLDLGTRILRFNPYVVQFVAQVLVAIGGYLLLKYFAFHVRVQKKEGV